MKKRKKEGSYLRFRIFLVLGFFLILFLAVFLRAFQLQILEGRQLKRMASNQHRKTVSLQSKRGDIYDRNLKELAVSIEVDSIYAQPAKIDSPGAVSRMLSRVLSMEKADIEERLKSGRNFVWLKRQIDLKEEQRKRLTDIEGIGLMKESRRYYPNRQLASNLIGFTGLDSTGLEGVELYYDNALKGVSRKFTSDKDAMGRLLIFEDMDKRAPVQGMEVELTIDKTIQYIAEKSLKKAVESYGAKGGSAVVMDPRTGEILAMASMPTFDPNNLKNYAPRQWRNRAVTDAFEPGSVLKLFLISAALEENAVRPRDTFYCENGSFKVGDRIFHDVKGYGVLTVPQIIKYSSNIGSAKIGERLGRMKLYRYLKSFGFGTKTGIDLPGESAGSLTSPRRWSPVTLETISFGQGISATPLQLVTALSSVANGGFLMKPYVVRAMKDSKGNVVKDAGPVIVRRVISTDTARKMTDMLVGVTQSGGTGVKAALDGFEVAGKTGTAQKADLKNGGYLDGSFSSSFFGFVPARNARIAVLVIIDEPKGETHGGTVAAPAFKEIASESLSYLGVYPDAPDTPGKIRTADVKLAASTWDARSIGGGAAQDNPDAVPDFTGRTVRAVLKMAKMRSMDVSIVGSGKAVQQRPGPGKVVPENGPVVVWFQ